MALEADGAGDLARLRAIAEAGRDRPLLGGPAFIVWGVAIALAAGAHWAVVTGLIAAPPWSLSIIWFGGMVGAAVVAATLTRGRVDGAALSAANRVSAAVWQVAGAFLGVLAIGLVVAAALAFRDGDREAFRLMSVMPPVTFGVYGIALTATAVAGDAGWLRGYGWLAFGFAGATAVLIGVPAQYLVMAAGAAVVSVLPGLRLLRDARVG